MSPLIKANEPVNKVFDFYILFRGRGKTVEEAFQDMINSADLSEIPSPEKAYSEAIPEVMIKELDEVGLVAIDNGPEEE